MMFRLGPLWVTNSPIETGSSASSCLRIKGQNCAKIGPKDNAISGSGRCVASIPAAGTL